MLEVAQHYPGARRRRGRSPAPPLRVEQRLGLCARGGLVPRGVPVAWSLSPGAACRATLRATLGRDPHDIITRTRGPVLHPPPSTPLQVLIPQLRAVFVDNVKVGSTTVRMALAHYFRTSWHRRRFWPYLDGDKNSTANHWLRAHPEEVQLTKDASGAWRGEAAACAPAPSLPRPRLAPTPNPNPGKRRHSWTPAAAACAVPAPL